MLKKLAIPFTVSAIFWLLLSGHYSGLMLFFGFVSCLLVAWNVAYLPSIRHDSKSQAIIFASISYLPWLIKEIVITNIATAKVIWSPKPDISPTMIEVPASQTTSLGIAIHANSITLTPSTLAIDVEGTLDRLDNPNDDNYILVHALTRQVALDTAQGTIDQKVSALEPELKPSQSQP